MRRTRLGLPQAIVLGFLLQSLPWPGPSSAFTETKPQLPRSAQKRTASKDPTAGPSSEQPERCVHVVRRGESLSRVAALYRTTQRSIVATNALTTPVKLRVGQRLQISGCRTAPRRHHDEPEVTTVSTGATELLARVGPRRVLTRLFLAVPSFDRDIVAFQWPIDGAVASAFGRRHKGWHAGVDIMAEMGTLIRASAGGTVMVSGWEPAYGLVIKIQHPDGFTSVYAHNLENRVEVGDEVGVGTVIGTVGRSGHASGNHLHFEIRHEGVAYNPLHLLETRDLSLLASTTSGSTAMLSDDEDRE